MTPDGPQPGAPEQDGVGEPAAAIEARIQV